MVSNFRLWYQKKVSNFGLACGLSSQISIPLWTTLINLSIEHEFKEIDKLVL